MAIWEQPNILSGTSQTIMTNTEQKPELGVYMIHTGQVTVQWAMRFKLMQLPPYIYMLSSNQPYDTSREMCARTLLKQESIKYIFSIDSDNLCPINTVPLLIQWSEQYNLPILSGLYWAKKPLAQSGGKPMAAAWIKRNEIPEENRIEYAPLAVKKLIEEEKTMGKNHIQRVDVCGAGCMLIKADVFRKLEQSDPNKPFFQWGIGRKTQDGKPLLQMSEDFYFCHRCNTELGIFPHVAIPIRCDHVAFAKKRAIDGEFELLHGLY